MNAIAKPILVKADPPDAADPAEIDRLAKKQFKLEQAAKGEAVADPDEGIKRKTLNQMIDEYPSLRPPVIDGLLRRGEVANIIASPKMGKSYLAGGLAFSVASGDYWLSYPTTQGKVLVIDNELHPETTKDRLCRIASAMMIDTSVYGDSIEVLSLRGCLCDIHTLKVHLGGIEPGEFALVILDALYRTLPEGTSENDNAAMTAIFNQLDAYAAAIECSIVVVHHASKGDQSSKGVTDVGSGAGAISRAADTHLIIRPHAQIGHAVLEAVTRSWKAPEPVSICWDYPVWTATTLAPEVRGPGNAKASALEKTDAADKELIIEVLKNLDGIMRQQAILDALPFGDGKTLRLLKLLAIDGVVHKSERSEQGSKRIAVWWELESSVLPASDCSKLPEAEGRSEGSSAPIT